MKKLLVISFFGLLSCTKKSEPEIIIVVSANAEWKVIKSIFQKENYQPTPWGEFFETKIATTKNQVSVIFFHEGWGKTSAAGATQFAIDKWNPRYLINLGTCGGFEGKVERFDILLVNKTIVYDIREAMGDSNQAIDDYSTELDLSWLKIEERDSVKQYLLISADRDIVPQDMTELEKRYHAIAADWESASIAYTCKRNNKKVIILRGVSDIVSQSHGEAYNNEQAFRYGAEVVMKKLINQLPTWLDKIISSDENSSHENHN